MGGVIHPGAALAAPFQQGGLDGLCGLYAIINAIRVLHAPYNPVSASVCRSLFAAGIEELNAKAATETSVYQGMTAAQQHRLARVLLRHARLSDRPRARLKTRKLSFDAVADFESFVEATIDQDAVLLVNLGGRIWHHTVATGLSARRLCLSDSSGRRFIYTRSISLVGEARRDLVLLRVASLSL